MTPSPSFSFFQPYLLLIPHKNARSLSVVGILVLHRKAEGFHPQPFPLVV